MKTDFSSWIVRTHISLYLYNLFISKQFCRFKACKSVHHRKIQINHQPDATIFQFIILTFIYSSTYFGRFPSPIIRSSMTAVAASGFTFVSWCQSCCVCGRAGRPARPQTQQDCHHDMQVKPEAATAVIELLMIGGTPETCWAVNKYQDNKLENCCIWLVIYLNLNWIWRVL